MGTRLSPDEAVLYRRLDEVLHYIWDPIGISGAPGARDEYRAYLPKLFELIKSRAPEQNVVDYLVEAETGRMGLSKADAQKAKEVAEICADWQIWIE